MLRDTFAAGHGAAFAKHALEPPTETGVRPASSIDMPPLGNSRAGEHSIAFPENPISSIGQPDEVLQATDRPFGATDLGHRLVQAFVHGSEPALASTAHSPASAAIPPARPSGQRKVGGDFGQLAKRLAPLAIGAGIPLAAAGTVALGKPEIRADLKDLFVRSGTVEEKDKAAPIPPAALDMAAHVGQALAHRGLDPRTLRIAVDAPPGTGKTTLSRALAAELGVKHYGLDWLPGNRWKRFAGGGHIEQMPRAPRAGEVLEHYNLLRSYDPELFDVALHIRKDPQEIKKQLIQRGRSAGAAAILDYDKASRVGDLAFDTLAGEALHLGDGVFMKVRPRDGWAAERLDHQLQGLGIDSAGLSRHEKLLSLDAGDKATGAGWRPYFKNPLSRGEAAVALGSIPLGVGAALAARHLIH